MTTAEIIILIVGALLFTVSFFIPDRNSESNGDGIIDKAAAEKAVREAVKEEMKKVKTTISEATEESISENKDKMERFMDRLTNEKMMAVNEYSDTVLNQIHKDHDEAVFLYDMIDSKYNQVKSTAAEINQIEKNVKKLSEDVPKMTSVTPAQTGAAIDQAVSKSGSQAVSVSKSEPAKDVTKKTPVEAKDLAKEFQPMDVKKVTSEEKTEPVVSNKQEEKTEDNLVVQKAFEPIGTDMFEVLEAQLEGKKEEKPAKKKQSKPKKTESEEVITEPIANSDIELMFDNGNMNNNDRILALHKEGKSNMAIAKELGLGVGEVKLVIDLFKS